MRADIGIDTNGSSPRGATPRRRFQLADAMILVAATAMGCAVINRVAKFIRFHWPAVRTGQLPWNAVMADTIAVVALIAMPLVAMVTLALLPIRLVGARPRFRHLARQPGLVASCASGLAMALLLLPVLAGALAAGRSWDDLSRELADDHTIFSATMYGGLAILVSWMTLFVGGRWRAEPTWIDRLGRAMALYWIVAAPMVWTAVFIFEIHTRSCSFGVIYPTPIADVGRMILQLATVAVPLVAVVTLVLLPIRLVGTRPRFRRLARQPGLMASCASGLAMALIGLEAVVMVLVRIALANDAMSWHNISVISGRVLDQDTVMRLARCGGYAVLVSWTTLFVGGKWRVERSWGDRLGRTIGFCWILAALAVVTGDVLIDLGYYGARLGSTPPVHQPPLWTALIDRAR